MQPILAESLDGWLFAGMVFFGGLIASALALCALAPARQGNRPLTITLAAPAFVVAMLATLLLAYGVITDGLRDPDYSISDFAIPWLMLAGPPLATSVLAIAVLWFRTRTPDV